MERGSRSLARGAIANDTSSRNLDWAEGVANVWEHVNCGQCFDGAARSGCHGPPAAGAMLVAAMLIDTTADSARSCGASGAEAPYATTAATNSPTSNRSIGTFALDRTTYPIWGTAKIRSNRGKVNRSRSMGHVTHEAGAAVPNGSWRRLPPLIRVRPKSFRPDSRSGPSNHGPIDRPPTCSPATGSRDHGVMQSRERGEHPGADQETGLPPIAWLWRTLP